MAQDLPDFDKKCLALCSATTVDLARLENNYDPTLKNWQDDSCLLHGPSTMSSCSVLHSMVISEIKPHVGFGGEGGDID
jgi:hypothetical protein